MKEIVLFIPGIFGSRLRTSDGEEVWPPTVRETLTGYGRTDKLLGADLQPAGVIGRVCIDVYGKVMEVLEGFGYSDGGTDLRLIRYSYDWRRDLLALADELDAELTALAGQYRGAAIKLVCHSMGGLLARACLERPAAAGRPWVDKVTLAVFLATPHAGAPLAFARAIGIGGSSMGVSQTDMRRLAGAPGYPAGYQLFPPAALEPIWDLESNVPLQPRSVFDPSLVRPWSLTVASLDAATKFHAAIDPARRPKGCRYFAVVSAAHETVTRFDKDLGDLGKVSVKASGDGTVPVTSAAALPTQIAFVHANHMGVPQKAATHQLLGILLGRLRPGPVIAAAEIVDAPALSLSDRIVEEEAPVEIVVATPPRDALVAEIMIARGLDGEELVPVTTLAVAAEAPALTRVALAAPPLTVGRHVFTLVVDGAEVDREELLVTRRNDD